MDLRTKKILRTVSKVILILVGVFLLGILGYVMYMSISNTPRDVRVTNLTDSSFSVSWVTDRATKGVVYYKEKGFVWPGKGYDDRDWSVAQLDCDTAYTDGVDCKVDKYGRYYVHHVTVRGLDAEKGYSFFVSDGIWIWKGDSVTTFSSLDSVGEPSPVFGKVVTDTGDVSNDSIVYVQFTDTSEHVDSLYYSSVTNSSGGWYVDASTVRDSSGNVMSLELTNDTFDANALYEKNLVSDVYTWVLGFFDMAYPDIEVKENKGLESNPQSMVLGTCQCATAAACINNLTALSACGDTLGYGVIVNALVAENGSVDRNDLESLGLCNSAVACAGNISAITGQGVTAYEIDSDWGNDIDDDVSISITTSTTEGGGLSRNVSRTGDVDTSGCTPNECDNSSKDGKYRICNDDGTWNTYQSGYSCPSVVGEVEIGNSADIYNIQQDESGNNYIEIGDARVSLDSLRDYVSQDALSEAESCMNTGGSCVLNVVTAAVPSHNIDLSNYLSTSLTTGESISFTEGDSISNTNLCTYRVSSNDDGTYTFEVSSTGDACSEIPEDTTYSSATELANALKEATLDDDMFIFGNTSGSAIAYDRETGVTIIGEEENSASADVVQENADPDRTTIDSTNENNVSERVVCGDVDGCQCSYYQIGDSYYTNNVEGSGSLVYVDIVLGAFCPTSVFDAGDDRQTGVILNLGEFCYDVDGCVCAGDAGEISVGQSCFNPYNNPQEDLIVTNESDTNDLRCKSLTQDYCECIYPGDEVLRISYGSTCPSEYPEESVQGVTDRSVLGTSDSSYFLLPEYGFYTLQVNGIQLSQKISKEDNTIYLFYVEGNGVEGYQVPEDINNPQSDEDKVIESNALEITYTKVSEQKDINLLKGLNMISFNNIPAISDTENTTAKDFILWLRGRGFDITNITYFSNGRWDGGIYCEGIEETSCSGNDFVLVPGKGYMVRTNEDISTSYPAYSLTSSVPISLSTGWNLIGVNGYTQTFTARTLIDSVNTMSDTISDNVTAWTSSKGKYEGFQYSDNTEYGLDFPISTANGYFVRVKSIGECNTRIWYYGSDRNGECIEN